MYQVSAAVWNQIAQTQELRTEFARRLFPLSGAAMEKALDAETEKLKARGIDSPAVRASYLMMAPLLWERGAIARFAQDNPDVVGALPNVEAVDEAVMISSMDRPMTASDKTALARLLREAPI